MSDQITSLLNRVDRLEKVILIMLGALYKRAPGHSSPYSTIGKEDEQYLDDFMRFMLEGLGRKHV